MAHTVSHERRAAPRTSDPGESGIFRARLRTGRTARIVDLSPGGALIETEWRLLPGSRIELRLGDPVPVFHVAGRILRSHVARLDRERVRYRGALVFDATLPLGVAATPEEERNG